MSGRDQLKKGKKGDVRLPKLELKRTSCLTTHTHAPTHSRTVCVVGVRVGVDTPVCGVGCRAVG